MPHYPQRTPFDMYRQAAPARDLADFFHATCSSDDEPPSKRRRVDADISSHTATGTSLQDRPGHVVLADALIPLHVDSDISNKSVSVVQQYTNTAVSVILRKGSNAQAIKNRAPPLKAWTTSQDTDDVLRVSLVSKFKRLDMELDLRQDDKCNTLLQDAVELVPISTDGIRPTQGSTEVAWQECSLEPPSSGGNEFHLRVRILWMVDTPYQGPLKRYKWHAALLRRYLPSEDRADQNVQALIDCLNIAPSIQPPSRRYRVHQRPLASIDFYNCVHVPADTTTSHQLDARRIGISNELFPFQKRAVAWMLSREAVQIGLDGNDLQESPLDALGDLVRYPARDATDQHCQVSLLDTMVYTASSKKQLSRDRLLGGILAEEMGLGKTVELISLICLHRRRERQSALVRDSFTNTDVTNSGATLIITPPSILEQWLNELEMHAPHLKAFRYVGLKQSRMQAEELKQKLCEQDVVVTTYSVLAREVHYAQDLTRHNLRHGKKYDAPRSPLIQIMWWRVCLDEAQMIETGVSNAAILARKIPRTIAWAVSGTPFKKDPEDLLGLLVFLRCEPFCRANVWRQMVRAHRALFGELFGRLAMRHTKMKVRNELRLPPQKRVVITVPFTAIEEQNYLNLYHQMCDDCGLDENGGPRAMDWNPNDPRIVEKMRQWLTRLRQVCLHAEIGARNRRALGASTGPLRTVDEVLLIMIQQNEVSLRTEERAFLSAKVMRGHLFSFGSDSRMALELYLEALEDAARAVQQCRQQLMEAENANKVADATFNKAKPDAKEEYVDSDDEDDSKDQRRSGVNHCKLRLRSALEGLHICEFFSGTAYFQLKEKQQDSTGEFQKLEHLEIAAYERAKQIRRELLAEVTKSATKQMKRLSHTRGSLDVPMVMSYHNARGIETRKVVERVEEIRRRLNSQAKWLKDWRDNLLKLLLAPLLDQEGELEMTGEEYETSTKNQDEQYVYLEACRALIADRHCVLTGQVNLLVNNEMQTILRVAKEGQRDDPHSRGHAPELAIELQTIRMFLALAPKHLENNDVEKSTSGVNRLLEINESLALNSRQIEEYDPENSVRGVIADARSLLLTLQGQQGNRAAAEAAILQRELDNLQHISSTQMKVLVDLEKELDQMRHVMNHRLRFYRSLQQLSDMVAPLDQEVTPEVDRDRVAGQLQEEQDHAGKVAMLRTKRRFLTHLRLESSGQQEQQDCIICKGPFEMGVLTTCGHIYCRVCIRHWWSQNRNCPVCKKHLKNTDFHEITYKPRDIQLREEQPSTASSGSPTSTKESIYADVSAATLREIKSYDLSGSYGTKVDTIARHIYWIREHDPGAKTIIFSQYRDFLEVLGSAFKAFKISYTDFVHKSGITAFRDDPSVECFLLHAKADSSGLNLVNATHVFLCEPLINAALELQAIARVHRIGQRRLTTVWMYLVKDTVEEAIYDISVSRRLALMHSVAAWPANSSRASTPGSGADERALDAANSRELQGAPLSKLLTTGQSGGEVVASGDLWECLFGRPARVHNDGLADNLDDAAGAEVGRFMRAEAADERQRAVGE